VDGFARFMDLPSVPVFVRQVMPTAVAGVARCVDVTGRTLQTVAADQGLIVVLSSGGAVTCEWFDLAPAASREPSSE
jgi:hypothetical protein